MTNKKNVILVGIIILGVLLIIIIKKEKNSIRSKDENNPSIVSPISYDKETELYYIKDETTGEIISASYYEEEMEFYKNHPDYNPNPLATRSMNLQDFIFGNDRIE